METTTLNTRQQKKKKKKKTAKETQTYSSHLLNVHVKSVFHKHCLI